MSKTAIFIDGSEGTTGLRIHERFEKRNDVELIPIDPEKRKDKEERKKLINAADVAFFCLPDAAAEESASLVESDHVTVIDTSTAHRTVEGWAYGFPELSATHREAITTGKRIAVPGCYATGFISLVYPMVQLGILPADYPVSAFGLSGYSGGGKKMIAAYEEQERPLELAAPREYALSQAHKHLKEMKKIPGLCREPLFSPIVSDYYSGMVVSVPLYTEFLKKQQSPEEVHAAISDFYKGSRFITVMPLGAEAECSNMLAGNAMSGKDSLRIFVTGNKERVLLSSQFDNLGKGASGAAIQCLNLAIGCEETKGLQL